MTLIHKPIVKRAWIPSPLDQWEIGEWRWFVTTAPLMREGGYYRCFARWDRALTWALAHCAPCPACGGQASSTTPRGSVIHNGCPGATWGGVA